MYVKKMQSKVLKADKSNAYSMNETVVKPNGMYSNLAKLCLFSLSLELLQTVCNSSIRVWFCKNTNKLSVKI